MKTTRGGERVGLDVIDEEMELRKGPGAFYAVIGFVAPPVDAAESLTEHVEVTVHAGATPALAARSGVLLLLGARCRTRPP